MGKLVLTTETLTAASAGTLEYDGKVPYFTPQGLERGVVPAMQYYRLGSNVAGSDITSAQSIFGVGVSLSGSTTYAFDMLVYLSKSNGMTSHTISIGYGGTATNLGIVWQAIGATGTNAPSVNSSTSITSATSNATVCTGALVISSAFLSMRISGTIRVNAAGTFIPQYTLSSATGGTGYSTQAGSYMRIYPIGGAVTSINVGTWA